MPAPHAFYSNMLAERPRLADVFVLFYFILLVVEVGSTSAFFPILERCLDILPIVECPRR